ncbi:MAG TPA: pilus assembly protein TadG-related protein [Abditibacteriaceae bacterium]|jgi:hypothetical protein
MSHLSFHSRPVLKEHISQQRTLRRSGAQRRRGVVAVYVSLGMIAFMGVAAISFDLSYLYNRKAEAQKAADAAALAGAVKGDSVAIDYARLNGYDPGAGASVVVGPDDAHAGWYRATVSRPERVFFARPFIGAQRSHVMATAVAEYLQDADVPLQSYGKENGPITLSMFGPNGMYSNGDPYSTKFLDNGQANPLNKGFDGYNFNLTLKGGISTYKTTYGTNLMQVEIYDPGCFNTNGPDAIRNVSVDEMRSGHGGPMPTTTQYTMYNDNGTPGVYGDDIEIGDPKTFGAGSDGPDMGWDKTFQIDLNDSRFKPESRFRLNVKTLDGSSENGFDLRAGPPHSLNNSDEWVNQYKDAVSITARGHIPINFNDGGDSTVVLGQVPPLPLGGQVIIEKFDTDIESQSVVYTDEGTGMTRNGILAGNGEWKTDTYQLPAGYSGGLWKARYTAGTQDTSVWKMRYTGIGDLRLIR